MFPSGGQNRKGGEGHKPAFSACKWNKQITRVFCPMSTPASLVVISGIKNSVHGDIMQNSVRSKDTHSDKSQLPLGGFRLGRKKAFTKGFCRLVAHR